MYIYICIYIYVYIYISNLIIMILFNNWIGNFGNLPNLQSPRPTPGLVGGAIEFSFPWRKSAENTVDSRGSVGPGEGLEMLPGTPAFLGAHLGHVARRGYDLCTFGDWCILMVPLDWGMNIQVRRILVFSQRGTRVLSNTQVDNWGFLFDRRVRERCRAIWRGHLPLQCASGSGEKCWVKWLLNGDDFSIFRCRKTIDSKEMDIFLLRGMWHTQIKWHRFPSLIMISL